MKRLIQMTCALCILALLICAIPCSANDSAVVTGETVTTTAGKNIEYRVSISGNPGLTGLLLKIRYDTAVLSFISCVQGDFSGAGSMTCGETTGGCNIVWYHSSDVSSDGTLLILTLHVAESAEVGTYPITLSTDAKQCVNFAEEQVPLTCVSGTVNVRVFVPRIYGEICSGNPGEDLLYSIYMEDNPGIASYHIRVIFDSDILEFADAVPGEQTYQRPSDGFGGGFQGRFYSNAFEAIWYNQFDVSDEGLLFSLRMKVKEGALQGEYPVTVQYVQGDTMNAVEQEVSFVCNDGTVIIERAINVIYTSSNSATVTIVGAKGQIVIAALFDVTGMQLAVAMKTSDVESTELNLKNTVTDRESAYCKVMLLDPAYHPVCEALTFRKQ